jgi:CHAT domain-containing protein/tetratricopeptide (TPR) repeat protein
MVSRQPVRHLATHGAASLVRAATLAALVLTGAQCGAGATSLDELAAEVRQEVRHGRLGAALALAEHGEARAVGTGDEVRAWAFRLMGADVRALRLETSAALEVLEAPVPDEPSFDGVRARQAFLLARILVSRGQLAAAVPLIERAQALGGGDVELALEIALLQSQILYRTGRAAEADDLLRRTSAGLAAGRDAYHEALVANTIGMGLVTRNRFDEALPHFERVLSLHGVQGTTVVGNALINAGLCLARLGQFDRAVALQRRAVEVHRGGRVQSHAQALGELGTTYLLADDIARGLDYLRQAFTIAADAGLRADAAIWARNLAAGAVALGRWDEAASYNQQAVRIASPDVGVRPPIAIATDAQIAAGRGQLEDARRLFEEALAAAASAPGTRWVAYDGLARLAVAQGRPADAARHFESALRTIEETASALLRADTRISFPSRLMAFYRGYVDFLLDRGEVERALEIADSSRARVLAERQGVAAAARVSVAELRRLARGANTTLVFYWLGPERSWAWAVTGGGLHLAPMPTEREIAALVAEHQAAIQSAVADPLAAGAAARLFDVLVSPFAAYLPAGARVTIVPDGPLHRVNFETLATGTPRRFWIEDATIQIAPSLAMLVREVTRPGPGPVLLVGNPEPRAPEFPALSYAPAEMASVREHFSDSGVTVIEGGAASPSSFREAAPGGFRLIHFTAHAVANAETPLDSAVILSGPEDGFKLYAREIAGLGLDADLVTVSSCRGAGERAYAGEGLIGFAWAFLRAGSRRVVAGLWDVDDRSTALLMDAMYAAIAAGVPPVDALREAKRQLIARGFPQPYYWAPFQLFAVVL